jgi:hypothetical protein
MIVIRYADDTIVGFQHEHEAQAFLDDLKERMRKFKLALHPDKTRAQTSPENRRCHTAWYQLGPIGGDCVRRKG